MLASDESSEATEHAIRTIEYDLNLISAQEQLSGAILESNGLDGGQNKRPLNRLAGITRIRRRWRRLSLK